MRIVLKKLTAWLCCVALLGTMLPVVAAPALAAEGVALTATSGTIAAGTYYLDTDLTLSGSFSVKSDVTIDLNGYTITMPTSVDKSMFVITAAGSLTVKDTGAAGTGKLQFGTTSSGSGSTNNAAVHEHPAVAVVHSGREPKRQAILVEVTPTTLTFTNYGLGTAGEDYVLADNVIDTFTIERVEVEKGSVTVEQPEHGTVSVDKTEGVYGETVTVTTKADSGYKLKEVLVDGVAIKGKSFTISGDHTVTAVFVERGDEPMLGRFSLEVVNYIIVNGEEVAICRWVWTPFEE